ncbi:MAG: PIN domain-containing protein [Pseudomonadota bacterium]
MTALVFVDTHVFVYAREPVGSPKQARAREWLELLWRDLRGRTSIQVLNEYYSLLTMHAKFRVRGDVAWEDVRELLQWNPQELDGEVLMRAHEIEGRYQLNWWDCLLIAAAQTQGCALLLTEDLQDKANYGGVTIRNPFELGVADEAGAYSVAPRLASRHRGRGRPRKERSPAAA